MKKRTTTTRKYQHSAFVLVGGVMKRIDVDAIVCIEAQRYQCLLCMEDGTVYTLSRPMGEVVGLLDEERFLRIHRSFCVNVDQIDEYWVGGVKMYGGREITVGREYREQVRERLPLLGGK